MSTAVPSVAAVAVKDAPTNAELLIELVSGENIVIKLHSWSPRIFIEGIFKFGFVEATDGTYYSASQIRSIKPR